MEDQAYGTGGYPQFINTRSEPLLNQPSKALRKERLPEGPTLRKGGYPQIALPGFIPSHARVTLDDLTHKKTRSASFFFVVAARS